MRVIIAGSRAIWDYPLLARVIRDSGFDITEVLSGGANGVDHLGQRWAANKRIPLTRFPADWERYGKSAGPRRNRQMAAAADAMILLWDGRSRGSANMLEAAKAAGLQIYEHRAPLTPRPVPPIRVDAAMMNDLVTHTSETETHEGDTSDV